ncbi:MAG: methylmalonyl-CoA mutase [Acetobacteraceae bacterium]|nr:methylmalonyl-CoA mutase [Acetobacteraceae bacterium]
MRRAPDFGRIAFDDDKGEAGAAALHGAGAPSPYPGLEPYLRGPYPAMYTAKPWTVRQYAGFSTAEESNAYYRRALAAGQTGLSVAFDLPTHRGYDSDHPGVRGDVGLTGVAVDSVLDMQALFDGIPLDRVSVSMTMSGAVLPVLALFLVAAAEQGAPPETLAGTIQNDILKEFIARNTYIYLPAPSMRIVADIMAFASARMPRFNSISVSGYHMHEAGAPADLELAYALANGLAYLQAGLRAGLPIDAFAPRMSFFWAIGRDHFLEVAKLRAARLLWARLVRERFDPEDPRSLCLRAHCQTSGWSLASQDVVNNVTRTWVEALAAVGGGTQSLHTNSLDEAFALPTDGSARIARDTQLFLQGEAGMARAIDPWGGSLHVERLTHDLAARAMAHIGEIDAIGGMIPAIEAGIPQRRIEASAARMQARIDSGEYAIIGVNKYRSERPEEVPVRKINNDAVVAEQIGKLVRLRAGRDEVEVSRTLRSLADGARGSANLLALAMEAARARATVGEMSDALGAVFGRHEVRPEPVPSVSARQPTADDPLWRVRSFVRAFEEADRRPPKILVAKLGQDGHDRGQKVVANAFASFGFEVEIGALFRSPAETAREAVAARVHVIGVSSLAAGHLTFVPELRAELRKRGGNEVMIVVGGVVPPCDIGPLLESGVAAVYGPGTNLAHAAIDLLTRLNEHLGYAQAPALPAPA